MYLLIEFPYEEGEPATIVTNANADNVTNIRPMDEWRTFKSNIANNSLLSLLFLQIWRRGVGLADIFILRRLTLQSDSTRFCLFFSSELFFLLLVYSVILTQLQFFVLSLKGGGWWCFCISLHGFKILQSRLLEFLSVQRESIIFLEHIILGFVFIVILLANVSLPLLSNLFSMKYYIW